MNKPSDSAMRHYRQVGTQSSVASSDPHKLILLLMNGAMDSIATARGHMERGDVHAKGECVSRAISIIEGLRISLDKSVGGDLVNNLDELYTYMNRRLLQANLRDEAPLLDEVSTLLREIREAWEAIPQHLRRATEESVEPAQAALV